MSMYNMLMQVNPFSSTYLEMLGLKPEDVGRFRDTSLEKQEDGSCHICILTRNGGGNRENYEEVTRKLRAHPLYVLDYDDSFDVTYATYVFKVPDDGKSFIAMVSDPETVPNQFVNPMARFKDLIDRMGKEGHENDRDVKRAIDKGKEIFAPIIDQLTKKDS